VGEGVHAGSDGNYPSVVFLARFVTAATASARPAAAGQKQTVIGLFWWLEVDWELERATPSGMREAPG
jgi:hypothetical protein